MRVPAGFEVATTPETIVAARSGGVGYVEDAVRLSGTLHAHARNSGGEPLKGRTTAWVLADPERDWVVRHYVRGGAVAPLLEDRYLRLGSYRPVREAEVSDEVRARGVATPQVQAFVLYPAGPFYRADIATARIPGATDLAAASLGPGRGAKSDREDAWRAAGRLLRATFGAGVVHGDLNLRNIVVSRTAGGRVAHLLDLDRCRIVRRCSSGHVHRMLQRLHRSRLKLESHFGQEVDGSALAAFEEALDG